LIFDYSLNVTKSVQFLTVLLAFSLVFSCGKATATLAQTAFYGPV